MDLRLSIAATVSDDDRALLEGGLMDHARSLGLRAEDQVRLAVWLRDSNGVPAAGLVGGTMWDWLEIRLLWVAENHRGKGNGTRLLQAAQTEALRRRCHGARLETYDPAALRFYERRGFERYGAVPDYPVGHTRYLLLKKLTA